MTKDKKYNEPRWATGQDIYRQFAHSGSPSSILLNPPEVLMKPHVVPSFKEILAIIPNKKQK